ncbi:MAG: capsid protein [Cressdnaviricota sp.]|nr:MAG: capsid protein [Cressdnaviricota sp.]
MKRRGYTRVTSKRNRGDLTVTITHTEYVRDIFPSAGFALQIDEAYNPGLQVLTPFLGLIGCNFEEYTQRKLGFHFRSQSSDSVLSTNSSTALGSVMMAFQYNVLSPAFTSKKDLLNCANTVSTKPSLSKSLWFNCRGSPFKKLWVRTPTLNTTQNFDRRLYDLCDFTLAVEGCQGTAGSIGELWCTTSVTFSKPTTQYRYTPFDIFLWNYTTSNTNTNPMLAWTYPAPSTSLYLPALVPPATFGGTLAYTFTHFANTPTGIDNTWAYFFPPVSANFPNSVWLCELSALPSASAQINSGSTTPLLRNCALTTLAGQTGLSFGNGVAANTQGVIEQFYVKLGTDPQTDILSIPVIAFSNLWTFYTNSIAWEFNFNVTLLQYEGTG